MDDIGYVICRPGDDYGILMDQRRIEYLEEAQHIKEILVRNEFYFLFPKFDTLPRCGFVILHLQGFSVISIIGLNPNSVPVGDLNIQITHTKMYTRIQIWLKTGNKTRN